MAEIRGIIVKKQRERHAAGHHAPHDDHRLGHRRERRQFGQGRAQPVERYAEQCRSAGPCRQPLPDAAGQKGPHDEPLGRADQLHRIDEVTLRVDRKPDRIAQQNQRNGQQRRSEDRQHQLDLVHRGVHPPDHRQRAGRTLHAPHPAGLGHEGVEPHRVGRLGREVHLETVVERVFAEHLLDLVFEHVAELRVADLRLLRDELDVAHHLVAAQAAFDLAAPQRIHPVRQFDGHRHALLKRPRHTQRGRHQIPHRTEQEQHQRHAHRRDDVGVAHAPFESLVVFHRFFRLYHSAAASPAIRSRIAAEQSPVTPSTAPQCGARNRHSTV